MKIVHVEDNFLPTSGYQLNFLAKYHVDWFVERIEDILMLTVSRGDKRHAKS
jgi:hypothetical protein